MMKSPEFKVVRSTSAWLSCLDNLREATRLAVDLEANSMFAYRERICLIQVSTDTQDYIIDPLAAMDLSELGQLFAEPRIEKIFHAAEYDLILMKREYDWEVNNLFDTMWAARILGYDRYGLASLLHQFYDIKLNKRYQRSNWCKRPLSSEQLTYACYDTHFLFRLRDRLVGELVEAGRMEEAVETFADQTNVTPGNNGFDPDSFWSVNGVYDLSRQQQAVLKACNIYRDEEAQRRDQPLFKIFSDRTLLEIAQRLPDSVEELSSVHGMSRGQIRRYGHNLLKIVKRALQAKPPAYPRRQQRKPDVVLNRYERLHTWRKERARERGVESDVIISRNALWEIADSNPQSGDDLRQLESVGEWRYHAYGNEILEILRASNNNSGR